MSLFGAILAGLAASAICLAVRSPSSVARRLDLVAPRRARRSVPWQAISERDLRHAGLGISPDRFLVAKVCTCFAGIVFVASAALFVPIGPLFLVAAGYGGWMVPSIVVARRAGRRRREADRAAIVLVERLDALVSAGRPPETALARILSSPTGAPLLDETLRLVHHAYLLGAPLFRTLAYHARSEGLETCAALSDDLERVRELGAASAAILRERRSSLRAAERARSLEAASQVEGKLMLVLALCYLPALMLLVVIPLFISLLDGLAV